MNGCFSKSYKFIKLFYVIFIFSFVSSFNSFAQVPNKVQGFNLTDCAEKLNTQGGGWCEIRQGNEHPSISSVWPDKKDKKIWMSSGPRSVLTTWNSAAFDKENYLMYFTGGGHANYGGNEVYQFNLNNGQWSRLTNPSPLNNLFVIKDYKSRKKRPWRRLCWVSDNRHQPTSAHTYDGLVFSHKTETLFYYAMNAANGSCFEDKVDEYKNSSLILGYGDSFSTGWHEFNPDSKNTRNGLPPLTWRKVFNKQELTSFNIGKGFPVTAELPNGDIIFGSKGKAVIYDPLSPKQSSIQTFNENIHAGIGLFDYDKTRNIVWFIKNKEIISISPDTGEVINIFPAKVPHGMSLAFDSNGQIISWGGESKVLTYQPSDKNAGWSVQDWQENGPSSSRGRVYGKWAYLDKLDLFFGIATHNSGVWVYKHFVNETALSYSLTDPQKLIDDAKPGEKVVIPAGIYGQGLFINKSIELDLKGVELHGVAKRKGIINIHCHNCKVLINNFDANGLDANCLNGNCAGIKVEGKKFHLELKNSHINNTVMGIISDNRGGTIIIEDSLIENTGLNDRSNQLAHGFYAGRIDKVEIRNSTIRSANGNGHLFKSRAPKTLIENSNIIALNGLHSRTIDFPCGGELTIRNSTLQHGANTDNSDIISVGTETKACHNVIHPSSVNLDNNWIIVERERTSEERGKNRGITRLFTWKSPIVNFSANNNKIIEKTGKFRLNNNNLLQPLNSSNTFYSSYTDAGLTLNTIPLREH